MKRHAPIVVGAVLFAGIIVSFLGNARQDRERNSNRPIVHRRDADGWSEFTSIELPMSDTDPQKARAPTWFALGTNNPSKPRFTVVFTNRAAPNYELVESGRARVVADGVPLDLKRRNFVPGKQEYGSSIHLYDGSQRDLDAIVAAKSVVLEFGGKRYEASSTGRDACAVLQRALK